MSERFLTWADSYPDIAQGAQELIPWPCDHHATDLGPLSQPVVSKGPDDELITLGYRRGAQEGTPLFHSTDGGRTWEKLSEVPPHWEGPQAVFINTAGGCGYLADGTIVAYYMNRYNDGRPMSHEDDDSHHAITYVVRSTDHGRTWSGPVALDPWPWDTLGGLSRIHEGPDGMLYLPVGAGLRPRPGKPLPRELVRARALLHVSNDGGRSWRQWSMLGADMGEHDVLCLDARCMIAVVRYQRDKLPEDPPDLVSPYFLSPEHRKRKPDCDQCRDPKAPGRHSIYKQTAVAFSADAGRTWTRPRIVTAWIQQTGSIVQLGDGTLILPFSHKDEGQGQRFIVSYDRGRTWSRAIFELHRGGMYASSVVLEDDTIVTVFSTEGHSGGRNCLEALRWKAPPRDVVSEKGFFEPDPVDVS